MALTKLGNSDNYVDTTKISGKTPVVKKYEQDEWSFNVICDGVTYTLTYDNETDANNAWAAIT